MRDCEQLLGSLGLFTYRIGSLDLLNEALSDYGPESCREFKRVTVKERKGQQTAIDKTYMWPLSQVCECELVDNLFGACYFFFQANIR